jgi:hypothetical protein
VEFPSGFHSPRNIIAGVVRLEEGLKGNFLLGFTHMGTSLQELGRLEEGLKENFLLGFTHLGTSLQELVGWRQGTTGISF